LPSALILGTGPPLIPDLARYDHRGDTIAVNAAGWVVPVPILHWVCAHPTLVAGFRSRRSERLRRHRIPDRLDRYLFWSRGPGSGVDRVYHPHDPIDQRAGSGLDAIWLALETWGYDRVVLAGMPYQGRGHIAHGTVGHRYDFYQRRLVRVADRLQGRVFSLSGFTRDLFGPPPMPLDAF